jgi:hypothetical protein
VDVLKIPKGYLSINIVEGLCSILVVAEGHSDLINALASGLQMSPMVFFDTFGEGILEIAGGVLLPPSPLKLSLLIGGIENTLAGIVSTYKTISSYVSPDLFFGGFIFSAIIGGILTAIINRNKPLPELFESVFSTAIKSGLIGAAGAVSTFFGMGVFLGLTAYIIGKAADNYDKKSIIVTEQQTFTIIIEEVDRVFPGFISLLKEYSFDVTIDIELNNDIKIINDVELKNNNMDTDIQKPNLEFSINV